MNSQSAQPPTPGNLNNDVEPYSPDSPNEGGISTDEEEEEQARLSMRYRSFIASYREPGNAICRLFASPGPQPSRDTRDEPTPSTSRDDQVPANEREEASLARSAMLRDFYFGRRAEVENLPQNTESSDGDFDERNINDRMINEGKY